MTGFADTLLARAHGRVEPLPFAAIQPRVPALFESPIGVKEAGDVDEPVAPAERPARTQPLAAQPVVRAAVQPREPAAQPQDATPPKGQPLLRVEFRDTLREREIRHTVVERETVHEQHRGDERPAARSSLQTHGIAAPITIVHPVMAAVPRVAHVERKSEPTEAPASRESAPRAQLPAQASIQPLATVEKPREAALVPSRRKERSGGQTPAERNAPAVPDVQITIGRIEIRAANAAPAPQTRRTRPQAMSLDEYRRQKQGETR